MKRVLFAIICCLSLSKPVIAEMNEEEAEQNPSDTSAAVAENSSLPSLQTSCTNGQGPRQLVRKVWVSYGSDAGDNCEVHYDKETEEPGNKQVLWRAQQDPEFCQERAKQLIDRLKGWGWSC